MNDRTCEICKKTFKYPSYLKRHKCQVVKLTSSEIKSNQVVKLTSSEIKSNQVDSKSTNSTNVKLTNSTNPQIFINMEEVKNIERNMVLQRLYYRPEGSLLENDLDI